MSHDFTDLPDLASRALGGGRRVRQRRAVRRPGEPRTPGPPVHDPGAFGPQRQGVRRLGDPTAAHARQRPGDRAARRAGRGAAAWSSTRPTSPATTRPGCAWTASTWTATRRPEELLGADWQPLVPVSELDGDTTNAFAVDDGRRLHARAADASTPTAASRGCACTATSGAGPARCSPAPSTWPRWRTAATWSTAPTRSTPRRATCSCPAGPRTTGEGWENARRRDAGNDHVTVRLAGRGTVRRLVVDTSCFVGNAPAEVLVRGCRRRARRRPRHRTAG